MVDLVFQIAKQVPFTSLVVFLGFCSTDAVAHEVKHCITVRVLTLVGKGLASWTHMVHRWDAPTVL